MNDAAKSEVINHFFKLHGVNTRRCYEPSGECTEPAIRAHSIPSGTVLEMLCSRDGHVVMPQVRLRIPPPAEICFQRVGRNNASTFTGLCRTHDNNIFRPIDDSFPDHENAEHLFLLAYRAVLREYHVVLQNAIRFQSTYQKSVESSLSPEHEPSNLGMIAISHRLNAYEMHVYKTLFDRAYLGQDSSALEHRVIQFANQAPTFAVSSLFSLDDVDAPDTPRVALTVYPRESGVVAVISATQTDSPFVFHLFRRLFDTSLDHQKYLLSKIVLHCCDNIVISPDFYDHLPDDTKEAMISFYTKTIIKNAWDHEDPRLFLF